MRKVLHRPTLILHTSGTLANHCNLFFLKPSMQQLPKICLPKVEIPLRQILFIPHAEELLSITKPRSKFPVHLVPHCVAASSNARPHSRLQILHPRSVLIHHPRDPDLDDSGHRPPPPRMKRPHHLLLPIHHQHWNAICSPNTDQNPGNIGYQSIAFQHRFPFGSLQPSFKSPISLPQHPDSIGMNLPKTNQLQSIFPANRIHKPPSILHDQSGLVVLRPAQIQGSIPINGRNPSSSRTEPMPQPPKTLPSRNAHHCHFVTHANSLILKAPAQSTNFGVS
jgi:hypothetical protein